MFEGHVCDEISSRQKTTCPPLERENNDEAISPEYCIASSLEVKVEVDEDKDFDDLDIRRDFHKDSAPHDCCKAQYKIVVDRWTAKQNQKFVELYKEHPHLWNAVDPNYKNRGLRRRSLELIRTEMGLNEIREVTKKIKNLRSTYYQELQKIEKSKKSNDGVIYTPTIQWFETMDSVMSMANLKDKQIANFEESFNASGNEFFDDTSTTNDADVNGAGELMMPPKRPRVLHEAVITQAVVNELKELNETLARRPEDDCDAVGRHVAVQLRQLTQLDRIDAIDDIQNILSRYRRKALMAMESSNPTPAPSNLR